ncbi:MAG: SdiA-regulated domain-containing protein [Candidatus Thiosymbion ectosymbiont of Robbea hypermnestra]|nr:SdiA-regulated domain-containing protein [Candidatus Thiosymbion ectosymbiont of Robbea hypermnestra]
MTDSTCLDEQGFSLSYLNHFKLGNAGEGLYEPSGLALSHGKNALWTISDDTKKIFKLSLDGNLKKKKSFEIPDKGLEGITLDPSGEFLLTIKEDDNEIIKIRIATRRVTDRQRLADMADYDTIARYFIGGGTNKGLEGITWNRETDTIFVMKEGKPGLLVEVSADLQTIRNHRLLNAENGFCDPEVKAEDLDFSDIYYDLSRDRFWIISDQARRLFLYDWKTNRVLQSARLGYGNKGEYREIEKAEGVAIDPDTNRLYVVSDEEARLYVFDIRT